MIKLLRQNIVLIIFDFYMHLGIFFGDLFITAFSDTPFISAVPEDDPYLLNPDSNAGYLMVMDPDPCRI
jgi:hypothetical protein